jgi:predicted nucleotidyltransferase
VISILRRWAQLHPEVVRVIIYGSRARGEHRPDSDFDVALELASLRFGETPIEVWLTQADLWRKELTPLVPWNLHLEWHSLEGKTPAVESKIDLGHYVVFNRTTWGNEEGDSV